MTDYEQSREIIRQMLKSELTPEQAQSALVALGIHPDIAAEEIAIAQGGGDCVIEDEE